MQNYIENVFIPRIPLSAQSLTYRSKHWDTQPALTPLSERVCQSVGMSVCVCLVATVSMSTMK